MSGDDHTGTGELDLDEVRRFVCPVHGIPDCSPLLNGCSIPRQMREAASKEES